MAARRVRLAELREQFGSVVLDTNVLIDNYLCAAKRIAPPIALPIDIPLEVFAYSLYEVLRGTKGSLLSKSERNTRRAWLDEHRVGRVRAGREAATTLESLVHTDSVPSWPRGRAHRGGLHHGETAAAHTQRRRLRARERPHARRPVT